MKTKLIYVLLGHMTFFDERLDGVFKTIIHTISEVKSFDSIKEAEEYGEESLHTKCESYLIPQVYDGIIEMDNTKTFKSSVDGYYAKNKNGKTLYQFRWSNTDKLYIINDVNDEIEVSPDDYEIIEIGVITG